MEPLVGNCLPQVLPIKIASRIKTVENYEIVFPWREKFCYSLSKIFFSGQFLSKNIFGYCLTTQDVHEKRSIFKCPKKINYGQNGDLKRHIKRCHTKEQEIIEEIANKQKL